IPMFYASEASVAFTWAERLKDFERQITAPPKGRLVRDLGVGIIATSFTIAAFDDYTTELIDGHARKLRESWHLYIDSRYREWCVIATLAVTYVLASPALPGANGDARTRSLTFISSLRAISSGLYATILLVFFRKAQSNTDKFALVWFQCAKGDKRSFLSMSWTILAMPAISLCWFVDLVTLSATPNQWDY
ncbi:hypothetical protein DXG01_005550, partial [Tephrocybe rancida]